MPSPRLGGRLAEDEVWPAGQPGHEVVHATLADGERVRVVRCRPPVALAADAPAVVCVHGWGCSAYAYNRNLRALAELGLDAIAPDVRGHGWSDKPLEAARYTPDALGRWLVALLDALAVPRAVLVGHSMGGAIVMRAALRAPERVTGLVLLAPVGFGHIPRTRLLRAITPAWLDPVLPYVATRATIAIGLRTGYGTLGRPTERDIDEYWAPTADPDFVRAARLVAHAFEWAPGSPEELARLACPVHLVLGERDHLVPGAIARPHVARLPDAVVDEIPGAGHVLPEEVPEAVTRAIADDVRAWWR